MFWDTVKQFNWMDIFLLIILFRVCYIAIERGIIFEIFKLLGTLSAVYCAMHYYSALGDSLKRFINSESVPDPFLDLVSFLLIAVVSYFIFVLLRAVFFKYFKMETVPLLHKWGGVFVGIMRGILLMSLLCFIFYISDVSYLQRSAKNSYCANRVFPIAPGLYKSMWDGVTSKFMTQEKFNSSVPEIEQSFKS